jgi:hypothetical protein
VEFVVTRSVTDLVRIQDIDKFKSGQAWLPILIDKFTELNI